MGKKKKNSNTSGGGGENKKGEDAWQQFPDVRENAEWEEYYRQQKIVPPEEWDSFLGCLRTDLPTAFRIVTSTPHQHYIREYIHRTMQQLKEDEGVNNPTDASPSSTSPTGSFPASSECLRQGSLSQAFRALSWFAQGSEAYQIDVSRVALRTCKPLLNFHRFLVAQSEAATIMRQEVVSMIPALFLDIKPDSFVLDLCAAPGSKTSQLLDRMHAAHAKSCQERRRLAQLYSEGEKGVGGGKSYGDDQYQADSIPPGVVVANDADSGRAHMLIHHLRHLHSPCLLVTCHSAQFFPSLIIPAEERVLPTVRGAAQAPNKTNQLQGSSAKPGSLGENVSAVNGAEGLDPYESSFNGVSSEMMKENVRRCPTAFPVAALRPLRFDCVLCDVPCSADGTLRKARSLWTRWHSNQGLGCHRLQLQILLRGIKLCKVGGRIVYSTCSFNPIENEAVVAAALARTNGAVELIDCSDFLPALDRRPGIETWRVYWEKEFYDNFEDVPDTSQARQKLRPTMFPQHAMNAKSARPPLHRCMRFLPHLNNTGGFFIAVLEKKKHLPCRTERNPGDNTSSRGAQAATGDHCSPPAAQATLNADGEVQSDQDVADEGVLAAVEPAGSPEQRHRGHDACSDSSPRQICRSLEQLQLDFVGLGWAKKHIEEQQRQYTEKLRMETVRQQAVDQTPTKDFPPGAPESSTASEAVNSAGAFSRCAESSNDLPYPAVSDDCRAGPCKLAESTSEKAEQACITEEKLHAAWRAACASLGFSADLAPGADQASSAMALPKAAKGTGVSGVKQRVADVGTGRSGLPSGIRASLFVRRRGEGENVSVKGESRELSAVSQTESQQTRSPAFDSVPMPRIDAKGSRSSETDCCLTCKTLSSDEERSDSRLCNGTTEKTNGMAQEDRKLLRTVWLVSRGVERVLCGLGRSRYKVISAGCVAFQARNASKYRLSYGGAQWLVPLALNNRCSELREDGFLTGDNLDNTGVSSSSNCGCTPKDLRLRERTPSSQSPLRGPRVLVNVDPGIMLALLGDGAKPPRVDMKQLANLPGGSDLRKTTEEGPLVLVTDFEETEETRVKPGESGESSDKEANRPKQVIAPAWRGRANIELMIDSHTCHALKCLLLHSRPPAAPCQRNSLVCRTQDG
ncbi:trna (cytosine -c)-methyltransferase [Cystoisospora suis]|uniref:Trna (Cytosine-c)-methyltransferase n=1 Tax=Cystoisospora suis TaxID=483139 RepID=A0A2C6KII7_9APIC|nr:trna (cytosine -c)-methyltransferase [Cystoisospora suis]